MTTTIQHRRGTAIEWTSANPLLSSGEIGFEWDTNSLKIGDGTNAWNSLEYFAPQVDGGPDPVGIEGLPPGAVVVIDKVKTVYGAANAWPATRPTSRTDLVMIWLGDTDPGGIAIGGDIVDLVG